MTGIWAWSGRNSISFASDSLKKKSHCVLISDSVGVDCVLIIKQEDSYLFRGVFVVLYEVFTMI